MTSEYMSPMRGGVEHVTYTLARGLRTERVDVSVVCAKLPLTEEEQDAAVMVLPQGRDQQEAFLLQVVIAEGVDIIVNQAHEQAVFDLCKVAAAKGGCKLVSVFHTDPYAVLKGLKDIDVENRCLRGVLRRWVSTAKWWLRFPYRYHSRKSYLKRKLHDLYEHSDAVVLLSEGFKPSFVELAGISDSSRLFAISNPVEGSASGGEGCRKEKILLFVGRMEFSAKRPDRIVRIWEKLAQRFKDWRLVMIGDGPALSTLIAYCRKRRVDRIEFTGRANPNPYYEKASILCVTSSYEGFGLVIPEAQGYGVVPVAYNSYEALADLVDNGTTGLLVKAFDERAYREALVRLMSHEEELKRMSEAARSASSLVDCSVEKIAREWIELFEKVECKK